MGIAGGLTKTNTTAFDQFIEWEITLQSKKNSLAGSDGTKNLLFKDNKYLSIHLPFNSIRIQYRIYTNKPNTPKYSPFPILTL